MEQVPSPDLHWTMLGIAGRKSTSSRRGEVIIAATATLTYPIQPDQPAQ